MAQRHQARHRGHDIEAVVDDDGSPSLTVDGETVPVRTVDGGYAVTYFEPDDDLVRAAKQYVDHLPEAR